MIRNIDNPRAAVIEGKLVMKVAENTALEVVDDLKYLSDYITHCHMHFKWSSRLTWNKFWKLASLEI